MVAVVWIEMNALAVFMFLILRVFLGIVQSGNKSPWSPGRTRTCKK